MYNKTFDHFFKMSGNENILDVSNQIYDLCALPTFWDNFWEKFLRKILVNCNLLLTIFLFPTKTLSWLLLNKTAKVLLKIKLALQKQAKFHRHFLEENHRRNGQFQNFSLKLYISLKDLSNYFNVMLKKGLMGNKDIQDMILLRCCFRK